MSTECFYSNWLNLEIPVGGEFVLNGVRMRAIECADCVGCMFLKEENNSKICVMLNVFKQNVDLRCHYSKRTDGKSIVFKEVK